MNDQSSIKDLMNHSQEEIDQLLYGKKDNTVFFTDDKLDGMALYQAGIENIISLGTPEQKGVFNRESIVSYIASCWNTGRPLHKKIIVCAAKDTRQEWKALLNQLYASLNDSDYLPEQILKYEFLPQNHYLECDAISDAMSKDLNKFTNEIKAYKEQQEEQENPRPGNILDYLESGRFEADQNEFKKGTDKKTGFPLFDRKLGGGLYAGLYVLGAVPAAGKTTFVSQIADQIAAKGTPVMFFSLEMSRLELVSKSIARNAKLLCHANNETTLKTALQIRMHDYNESIENAIDDYKKRIAPNINIIEGNFETTLDTVSSNVTRFIEKTKKRPVVIIDYLQVLQSGKGNKETETRLKLDKTIKDLKILSSKQKIPVILVSSFNRENYMRTSEYESFKETGGIDYTADVLLGMEYAITETFKDLTGSKEKVEAQAREKIEEAKRADMKKIKIRCIKNRYGKPGWNMNFNYDAAHDYFREDTEPYKTPLNKNIKTI